MCNFACCCVSGNAVFYKLEQTSLDTGHPSFPYFGIKYLKLFALWSSINRRRHLGQFLCISISFILKLKYYSKVNCKNSTLIEHGISLIAEIGSGFRQIQKKIGGSIKKLLLPDLPWCFRWTTVRNNIFLQEFRSSYIHMISIMFCLQIQLWWRH